jgi:hypothetical protein
VRAHDGVMSGRRRGAFYPLPASFYRRTLSSSHPLASSQLYAQALARQLNYGNSSFNFNNGAEGYAGLGMANGIEENAGYGIALNWHAYTIPIYVIRNKNQPKVKVWAVESQTSEVLRPEVEPWIALQAAFSQVPMPLLSDVKFGQLQSEGTDKECVVIDLATGQMWEMWGLGQFASGPHAGEWKFGDGEYIGNIATCSGFPTRSGGALSASGLPLGYPITFQDIIEVLRGEITEFGHALDLSVHSTNGEHVEPAVGSDHFPNELKEYENAKKEKVVNPAYLKDAVPEGMMVRLPFGASIKEFGSLPGGKIETVIFNTLVNRGAIVRDHAGSGTMTVEDYHSLGSPYMYQPVNPYAGEHVGAQASIFAEINATLATAGSELKDTTVPTMTETFAGPNSVVYKMMQYCANELKQIEPFSS